MAVVMICQQSPCSSRTAWPVQKGPRAHKSVTWADEAPEVEGFHFSGQRKVTP